MNRPSTAIDTVRLLVLPLAALIAISPLLLRGCSCGHDFDFHLLSWMEAAAQLSHGTLHLHWAFSPAFNAGEPRFVFYPPVSWYLGAVLGLLLTHLPGVTALQGWTSAPIVFTWAALTASGLALYRLARTFATPDAALLAATLYLLNPYMLFTAYERTAYAELLAAAFIPLLLLAILKPRVTVPGIAIPLALLWLTNAPAAVMGSYTLAFLAALRLLSHARARKPAAAQLAFTTFAGTILGFALAAFYILPAAYERRYVQIAMAMIGGMRITDNFLFEHTGTTPDAQFHDLVLRTASRIAIALIVASAAALLVAFSAKRNAQTPPSSTPGTNSLLAPLAILTAGIAFLLTPLSAPIWLHAPQAAFLQFPWRLLSILAAVAALASALAYDAVVNRKSARTPARTRRAPRFVVPAAAILLSLALTLPAYRALAQRCSPEDTVAARLTLFTTHGGTDPTDEYTPITADNDFLSPTDPPYWLASSPNAPAPNAPAPAGSSPGLAPNHLTLQTLQPEVLTLNLRDFPAWHVTLNGHPAPPHLHRDDGLISLALPAGSSVLDIRYVPSADQTTGDILSALAALALLTLLVTGRRTPSSYARTPSGTKLPDSAE